MHFIPDEIYHVYNRGNNKQQIFFNDNNYVFFLKKIRSEWKKYGEILAYCLMPNHFHFMIMPNEEGCKNIIMEERITHMQHFSKAIGKTLGSYIKAINIQNQTTGNLFQRKTQAKNLSTMCSAKFTLHQYLLTCFYYIHQNPVAAKIVRGEKDWPYSSYPDYFGYRNGTLCNKELTMKLLSFTESDFKNEEVVSLNKEIIAEIF